MIDNIGLPYSSINMTYSTSAPIGTMDADILVTLADGHRPTERLRPRAAASGCRASFPGVSFYFIPADIVSQILNFGLPAPIDVQIGGPNSEASREFATNADRPDQDRSRHHRSARFISPSTSRNCTSTVDRTKAAESGFTQLDVASSVLVSLSGSFQTTPEFWLDPRNGVSYSVVTQAPQYTLTSLSDLQNIPISSRVVEQARKFWATWPPPAAAQGWPWFRTTTSSG